METAGFGGLVLQTPQQFNGEGILAAGGLVDALEFPEVAVKDMLIRPAAADFFFIFGM